MRPLAVTALTAVSAMGRGRGEMSAALRRRQTGLTPCGFAGITQGYVGLVPGLDDWRLPADLMRFDCRNNRLADMTLRTDDFAAAVARARDTYGPDRIAVVLGTSTSGILSSEEAYRKQDPATGALPAEFNYEFTHDLFSLPRYVRAALRLGGPALSISTACASSARSFVDAAHLLQSGICDAAVVGGVDTLCALTLRGFLSLQLVSERPCRPCDASRSGISLGEAGGFALLERAGEAPLRLLGYGTTSDGHHMSSPDPQGVGAAEAMRAALASAGREPAQIDYVNLHGTGTRANDAMEDLAVSAVFGDRVPCSSTKGWSGHTLGAAGILEAMVAALAIEEGLMPGCLGVEQVDPAFTADILTQNRDGRVRHVLSNSFGFGGVNCSLLFGAA